MAQARLELPLRPMGSTCVIPKDFWLPTDSCRSFKAWAIALVTLIFVSLNAKFVSSQTQDSSESAEIDPLATAVWIDDEPAVRWGEVERLVASQVSTEKLTPPLLQSMRSQAQRSLLGRRLILLGLKRQNLAPTDRDVEVYTAELRERLEVQGIGWETHLTDLGVTEEEFAESVRFSIGWRQVLEQRLTDENLQRYFDDHRRDYDGTELEVSQIVKLTKPDMTKEQREELIQQLTDLRAKIESGEISFADAAKVFSEGATADEGGSLGRIARHNAMPEVFSQAAFELEAGGLSPVIESSVGVHLIRCDAVHAGSLVLEDVKDKVRQAATVYLFEWYVEQESSHHTIRFDER